MITSIRVGGSRLAIPGRVVGATQASFALSPDGLERGRLDRVEISAQTKEETMITSVTVRPNEAGGGWFVLIEDNQPGNPKQVGGLFNGDPIYDMSIVQAEVSRWTTRMLLGHAGP